MYNKLAERTTSLLSIVFAAGVIGSAAAGVAAGASCSLLLGIAVGFFGAVNTFIGVTVICVLRKLIIHIDRLTDGGATDIGKRDARR